MSIRAISGTVQAGNRLSVRPRPDISPLSAEHSVVNAAVASGPVLLPPVGQADAADKLLRHYRPAAPFVAHMIATFQGLPQTRDRGRASGEDTAAAYRNVQIVLSRAVRPEAMGLQGRLV